MAWRQNGNPARIVGRIVQSDGSLGDPKVMASGVTAFEQNFDISYDSVKSSYLLAHETARGLLTQLFSENFVKQGPASLIEGGVTNSGPRLAYDPVGQKFLIFWAGTQDGTPRRIVKSRVLDANGKPAGDIRNLATAPAGKSWGTMSVSTNPNNGNLMLMVLEAVAASGSLVGFNIKPDGSLLRPQPARFQPTTAGLNTSADASFLDAGTGFGIWSDKTAIKYRKISATGTFASGTKSLAGVADANSIQTSLLLDSRNNQFIGVWTHRNLVRATALNTVTGAVVKQPFQVATSLLTNTRNAVTSYDPQEGNAFVVWEDSNLPASTVSGSEVRFRTRAAIFFIAEEGSSAAVNEGPKAVLIFSPSALDCPSCLWAGALQPTVCFLSASLPMA